MSRIKILLVDDDKVSLKLLDNILKSEHYQTTIFSNVKEAMDHLSGGENHPDLIISDYFMPDISGLEFLNMVKSKPEFAAIPFLFISANKNEEIETGAFQYGAMDFLKKPINKPLLLNKINALLQSLGSFSLKANRVFEGDSSMMDIHEIIAFCEDEKLDGFALIIYEKEYGILTFSKGILDTIQYSDLNDSEALERLEQLEHYKIFIFRGKVNDLVIQSFFDRKAFVEKGINKNISLDNIKGAMSTDKFNDLTLLSGELSDTFEKMGKLLNDRWISTTISIGDNRHVKLTKNDNDIIVGEIFTLKA